MTHDSIKRVVVLVLGLLAILLARWKIPLPPEVQDHVAEAIAAIVSTFLLGSNLHAAAKAKAAGEVEAAKISSGTQAEAVLKQGEAK